MTTILVDHEGHPLHGRVFHAARETTLEVRMGNTIQDRIRRAAWRARGAEPVRRGVWEVDCFVIADACAPFAVPASLCREI